MLRQFEMRGGGVPARPGPAGAAGGGGPAAAPVRDAGVDGPAEVGWDRGRTRSSPPLVGGGLLGVQRGVARLENYRRGELGGAMTGWPPTHQGLAGAPWQGFAIVSCASGCGPGPL